MRDARCFLSYFCSQTYFVSEQGAVIHNRCETTLPRVNTSVQARIRVLQSFGDQCVMEAFDRDEKTYEEILQVSNR